MRLSFSVAGDQLLCTVADETLSQKRSLPYAPDKVAALARAAVATLVRGNQARSLADANLAELRRVGDELWRALIAPELEQALPGSGPLLVEIDEALVAIPWELLFDGQQFLCQRFDLARAVVTPQARRGGLRRSVGTPISVLLLLSDPRRELAGARGEVMAIAEHLDTRPIVAARVVMEPTSDFTRRHLKEYDVVHYAGHAAFNAEAPDDGGWHLSDGTLSAADVAALGGGRPMPLLVFSNACQTSTTDAWRADAGHVYGLANAFLLAGVRHYIGTQWEVVDGQSARFAEAFYADLVDGTSTAAALRRARQALAARSPNDLTWASYVLYGDPEFAPLHRPESSQRVLSIAKGAKIDLRASAPHKRPVLRAPTPPGASATAAAEEAESRRATARGRILAGAIAGAVGLLISGVLAAVLLLRPLRPDVQVASPPSLALLGVGAVTPAVVGDGQRLEACLDRGLTARQVSRVDRTRVDAALALAGGARTVDKRRALTLGAALGVRWVAFGSAAPNSGSRVELTVMLADARTGEVTFADSLDAAELDARCDAIAAALAQRIHQAP